MRNDRLFSMVLTNLCVEATWPTAPYFCICRRSTVVNVERSVNSGRRSNELQPRILGGLLDVVTGAFRELPSVQIADLPRMADFARFGEAVGRALGSPANTFLSAYLGNRKDASARRSKTRSWPESCLTF